MMSFIRVITFSYKVDRKLGKQPWIFNRRHNANILGTYMFGKEKAFEISAR